MTSPVLTAQLTADENLIDLSDHHSPASVRLYWAQVYITLVTILIKSTIVVVIVFGLSGGGSEPSAKALVAPIISVASKTNFTVAFFILLFSSSGLVASSKCRRFVSHITQNTRLLILSEYRTNSSRNGKTTYNTRATRKPKSQSAHLACLHLYRWVQWSCVNVADGLNPQARNANFLISGTHSNAASGVRLCPLYAVLLRT